MSEPTELTLAQQLQLRSLELLADQMSPEQLRSQLIEVVRKSMEKDNVYAQMLAHPWQTQRQKHTPDKWPQEPETRLLD